MVSALCQHPHSSLGHGVDFGGTDFELVPSLTKLTELRFAQGIKKTDASDFQRPLDRDYCRDEESRV